MKKINIFIAARNNNQYYERYARYSMLWKDIQKLIQKLIYEIIW